MKGLVVREPWVSKILSGEKTWEMRSTGAAHRGVVALIRKGSGLVVGTARLVDIRPPLRDAAAYGAAERFHRISPDAQADAIAGGWTTPWVLADARPLPRPVPYKHKPGAVIWATLEPEVIRQVKAQLDGGVPDSVHAELERSSSPTSSGLKPNREVPIAASASNARASADGGRASSGDGGGTNGAVRVVTVTGGNLRNGHIYLPLDFFPTDAIGGKNRSEVAPRTVEITFEPGRTVSTDIDGTKRILRDRSAIRNFFERTGMEEGDAVVINQRGGYAFSVRRASRE